MQAHFHPDIPAFDLPMMQKALRKRGLVLDFDKAWKNFKQSLVATIAEKKPAAWDAASAAEDPDRFYRLIAPFSDLRISAYLQVKEGQILVWILEVGNRMDVLSHLVRRNDVAEHGITFSYPAGKFAASSK